MTICWAASAGMTSSLKTRYCSSISACASATTTATSAWLVSLSGRRAASIASEKRTSKNSSMLDDMMQM